MRSRRGVYQNIYESDYPFTVGDTTFYFSSIVNRQRFMDKYLQEMDRFNLAANRIYKNKYFLVFTQLSLVHLYRKVEKRGFYLIVKGEEVKCLENLRFHLETNVVPSLTE
jgi:hypothetical protein